MKKWRDLQIVVLLAIVFVFGMGIGDLRAEDAKFIESFPLKELLKQKKESSQDSVRPQAVEVESSPEGMKEIEAHRLEPIDELEASKKLEVLEEKPLQELEEMEKLEVFKERALVEEEVLEFDEEIKAPLEEISQQRPEELEVLEKAEPATKITPLQKLKSLEVEPTRAKVKTLDRPKKLEVLKKAEPVTKIKAPVQLDQGAIKEAQYEKRKLIKDGILPIAPKPQLKIKSGGVRQLEK